MIINSLQGYFSIVRHREFPDELLIRARRKADLESLSELSELPLVIFHTPNADYPFRVFVKEDQFKTIMYNVIELVLYPNFKKAISDHNPKDFERIATAHNIWANSLDLHQ